MQITCRSNTVIYFLNLNSRVHVVTFTMATKASPIRPEHGPFLSGPVSPARMAPHDKNLPSYKHRKYDFSLTSYINTILSIHNMFMDVTYGKIIYASLSTGRTQVIFQKTQAAETAFCCRRRCCVDKEKRLMSASTCENIARIAGTIFFRTSQHVLRVDAVSVVVMPGRM